MFVVISSSGGGDGGGGELLFVVSSSSVGGCSDGGGGGGDGGCCGSCCGDCGGDVCCIGSGDGSSCCGFGSSQFTSRVLLYLFTVILTSEFNQSDGTAISDISSCGALKSPVVWELSRSKIFPIAFNGFVLSTAITNSPRLTDLLELGTRPELGVRFPDGVSTMPIVALAGVCVLWVLGLVSVDSVSKLSTDSRSARAGVCM
jgi:hypothetical protein